MSELISAEEARRKSDEGREKAIVREIAEIKHRIDIAIENGEYHVTLPIGTRPYSKTV